MISAASSARSRRTAALGCVATAMASVVIFSFSGAAAAGEFGNCPGVESVQADLEHKSSSAFFIPGLKLIVLNRPRLKDAAVPVQKFIFDHECAHADPAIGEDEDAADCAAAKRARDEGRLGKTELIQICMHLAHMPADATHKPAGMRCANIRRCAAAEPAPQSPGSETPAPEIAERESPAPDSRGLAAAAPLTPLQKNLSRVASRIIPPDEVTPLNR